jgi:hypothetical protein
MTDENMSLRDLLEKTADTDLLRTLDITASGSPATSARLCSARQARQSAVS